MSEEFTAVAMCPKCRGVGVWPWREPRKKPTGDDPVSRTAREQADITDAFNLASWKDGTIKVVQRDPPFFDPDDAVVVRQCSCGFEWAQK